MRDTQNADDTAADRANAPTQMSPLHALLFARRVARARAFALGRADLVEDLSAEAMLHLISEGLPFSPAVIAATVRREALLIQARARAEHRCLQRFWRQCSINGNHAASIRLEPASAREAPHHSVCDPMTRRFADGSLVFAPTATPCLADIGSLRFVQSNGLTLQGLAALRWAQIALLKERPRTRHPQQASNVARARAALVRDAALLSVATLPWQEALSRLAERGIALSRTALRSGLRAARLRAIGKTAHG